MNALRSVLLYLWCIGTMIPWGTAVVLASLFVRGTPLYRLSAAWTAIVVLPGARLILGVTNRVTGRQHVPDGPVVLLVKHQSLWETLALPSLVSQPLSYVLKQELLRIPFFGWALGRLDCIQIDRSQTAAAYECVLHQGQRFLAQGNAVVMFPEGTRIPRGQRGRYKTGGTRLAVSAGVPVVPVAVASARCFPKGWVKRPGVVDISFGPPIASDGKSPEQLMHQVTDWIETEMRRIDPQAYPADEPDTSSVQSTNWP